MTDARTHSTELELHGIGISSGILVGKSRARGMFAPAIPHRILTEEQIPEELNRLEQAVQTTVSQLTALKMLRLKFRIKKAFLQINNV